MVDETKFFSRMFYSYSFEGPATRATTSSSFGICTVNVCANGGTCQTVPGGGFRCICPSGFFGFYCTVIFPCLSLSICIFFFSYRFRHLVNSHMHFSRQNRAKFAYYYFFIPLHDPKKVHIAKLKK